MHILLTNDDSHSSPLFLLAIEHLKTMGDLTIVVPNEEQSWTGKSITRFSPLYVEEIQLGGLPAFGVSGTPADCANLALHHLVDTPPDLVVSGINIGCNTGLGFTISSGTVGACLEANIAGVPAIALSQDIDRETRISWAEKRYFQKGVIERFQSQSGYLLDRVFETLLADDRLAEPVTWNVNLPFHVADDCRLVNTFLGHTFYGSIFQKTGDQYHHNLESFIKEDQRDLADGIVVQNGHVSMTRLDIRHLGNL